MENDAILLELPGFVVDVLYPPAHMSLSPQAVPLHANVTMLCGCPITPGGLWDANKYEVKALLKQNGKQAGTLDLQYAGQPSQFEAVFNPSEPGVYEVVVYAFDRTNGNIGLDSTTFIIK